MFYSVFDSERFYTRHSITIPLDSPLPLVHLDFISFFFQKYTEETFLFLSASLCKGFIYLCLRHGIMTEIMKKFNIIELMKGGLLYSLILSFLLGIVGQEFSLDSSAQSSTSNFASDQSASEKVYIGDSSTSSFLKIFVEIEIEEEEEQEDHPTYASSHLVQLLSLPLLSDQTTYTALFPHKKLVKLFILFHSWKFFLP